MKQHAPTDFVPALRQAAGLSTEDYLRALHPETARGKATLMHIDHDGRATSRSTMLDELPARAALWVEGSVYVTLNRFAWRRTSEQLVELNAIYLDLDIYRAPVLVGRGKDQVVGLIGLRCIELGLPDPSLVLDTGRGVAAIWLLDPLPAKAEPRWRAAIGALVEAFAEMGADSACTDSTRVFRVPGTLNPKSDSFVTVIGGTLGRHSLDKIADPLYSAVGRKTRAQLKARTAGKTDCKWSSIKRTSVGLSPRRRFAQIKDDLDRLCAAWGGTVPTGRRNIWLHLYATCLTHIVAPTQIESLVEARALQATPGLSPREVAALIKNAVRRAEGAKPVGKGKIYETGFLHYAGAKIADLLEIDDVLSAQLGLRQIMSDARRKAIRAAKQRARRADAGAMTRAEYLAQNSASRDKPWEALGISRATWYRRRKATPLDATTQTTSETGPRPQQGGSATPSTARRVPQARSRIEVFPPARQPMERLIHPSRTGTRRVSPRNPSPSAGSGRRRARHAANAPGRAGTSPLEAGIGAAQVPRAQGVPRAGPAPSV